jgi:hypothetical protein
MTKSFRVLASMGIVTCGLIASVGFSGTPALAEEPIRIVSNAVDVHAHASKIFTTQCPHGYTRAWASPGELPGTPMTGVPGASLLTQPVNVAILFADATMDGTRLAVENDADQTAHVTVYLKCID